MTRGVPRALNTSPTNSYARFPAAQTNVSSGESLGLCFSINSAGSLTNGQYILDRRSGANTGWEVKESSGNKIRFSVERSGSGTKNTDTNAVFNTNTFRTVCFQSNSTHQTIYVDGALDTLDSQAQSGHIASSLNQLYVGVSDTLTDYGREVYDELCVFRGQFKIKNSAQSYHSTKSCESIFPLNANGNAIRATYPIAFDTNNKYWLQTRKTTSGIANATVHLYNEGTGSIQSLLTYETITTGDDVISLPINQNISASLRLYTSTTLNRRDKRFSAAAS